MGDVGLELLDLAVRSQLPRALAPEHDALTRRTGDPTLTDAALDTGITHEMAAHYGAPRAHVTPLWSPIHDPTTVCMEVVYDGAGDPLEGQQQDKRPPTVMVHGPSEILQRVRGGDEMIRRTIARGITWPDVAHPMLLRVLSMHDEEGSPIGSVIVDERDPHASSGQFPMVPHGEALRRIGIALVHARTDEELAHLYEQANSLFGPGKTLSRLTWRWATPERHLDPEAMFRVIEFWDRYGDDDDVKQAIRTLYSPLSGKDHIKALLRMYGDDASEVAASVICPTEALLHLCDSKDDLVAMARVVQRKPKWLGDMMHAYSTLYQDTAGAGDPDRRLWEKPFAYSVYTLGRDLIKAALLHRDDPAFREDFFRASMAALYDALNDLHGIDLPEMIPKESDFHGPLTDFALERAGNMIAMTVIAPYVEELMLRRLSNLPPGEMERATRFFYGVIGPALDANADRATGDTEKQRTILEEIFTELHAQGRWKQGGVFFDLGSGNRKRIGERFYEFLRQLAAPSHIYAVDAIKFSPSAQDDVHVIRMDLENSGLSMIHARQMGQDNVVPADAAMMMWSVLNDIGPDKLQDVLDHIALMLRKAQGDRPGGTLIVEVPMGYFYELEAKAQALGLAALPAAELRYPVGGGKTVDKPLSIVYAYEMLVRAMRAGFRPLNLPPGRGELQVVCLYDTKEKKRRAFFVFERVGDPQMTLEQAALLEGQVLVGTGRPEPQA